MGETENRPRKRIGRYLVTGRIGRGGMGMVYRGYDEVLEREVAVKTLTLEGQLDEENRKRFEIEAKAAARLQHPNILTVFELGEDRGVPFIAMELLPGVDLEHLMRSGEPLLLQEKLDIMAQVCRGLAYAHEHGIVHRDIKPSNIRLLDDGVAKIMDFGIAKLGATSVTKSGMMVGTVHYMSPEQIRGRPLDGRSDVFSVGVILYELLAGARPFGGKEATEVLYKIVHETAEPVPADLGTVGPRLQEVLARALAKEPEARYPGAARMADELVEILTVLTRPAPAAPEEVDSINVARRLLKEGRLDESQRRLQHVLERNPHSLPARRALRAATRELRRRQRPPEAEPQDFPELDATFQVPPTRRAPETLLQPSPGRRPSAAAPASVAPAEAPPRSKGRGLLFVGGGALATAVAAGLFLLQGSLPIPGPAPAPSAAQAAFKIPVRSKPPGAAVLADGKDTGVVTDGELSLPPSDMPRVLLTFRRPGYAEVNRVVSLPPAKDQAVSVELLPATATVAVVSDPSGASVSLDGRRMEGTTPLDLRLDSGADHRLVVSLDGYAPREVALPAGKAPPEVRVSLLPAGPMSSVQVSSDFPLDVLWRGRVLAKAQVSPRVSLPAGRQVLTLVSSAYFLRANATVDVRSGADVGVDAPGLGKVSIKANPDNCEVFIDGSFVDYPPILEKPVAAGTHRVSFKWPDGTRREEVAEVMANRLAYVMGRKD